MSVIIKKNAKNLPLVTLLDTWWDSYLIRIDKKLAKTYWFDEIMTKKEKKEIMLESLQEAYQAQWYTDHAKALADLKK
jgi:hypothetical protein